MEDGLCPQEIPERLSLSMFLSVRHCADKMVKLRTNERSPNIEWKYQGKDLSEKLGRFIRLRYLKQSL